MSITLTIDGKTLTAKAGQTVLECALQGGIDIPHLCTHPSLPAFGACRLCVVEIEDMAGFPTACTTPAAEAMVVRTNTTALQNLRRNILALIMLEHPSACLVCDKRELCEQYRPDAEKAGRTTGCHTCNNKAVCEVRVLADELQLSDLPVPPSYHQRPVDRANPFIDRDLNLCILCGRCVRICKHQQGTSVIDFVNRGSETYIGTAFGRSLADAGCTFCGSCIDVCPTGALAERYAKWYSRDGKITESTCIFCDQACALEMETHNGKLISVRAINEGVPICVLGRFAVPEFLNSNERLAMPYIREDKQLRRSNREKAIEVAGEKLKKYTGDAFAFICDTSNTLEERYIFKKFTNEAMKSNHYIEVEPDAGGVSRTSLPAGVKAAILTGNFLDEAQTDGLELLIVLDCFPTDISRRADIVFPAAVFAEVDGTVVDACGVNRPLRKACEPPGQAKDGGQIICKLAQAMGAEGFDYKSSAAVAKDLKISKTELWVDRQNAPAAALDMGARWTHFRGHSIDDKVSALKQLPVEETFVPSTGEIETAKGFKILRKTEIAPNVYEIVIEAPDVAREAKPGQFVIVMVDEKSERTPLTLCDWDAEKGTVTLIVLEAGQSSRKLVLLKEGDKLAHLVGPLGVPLEIKHYGTVVLAGGCYGLGAVLRIASALKEAGNKVTGIVEARSSWGHFYKEKLEGACDEFVQTTIDGSSGIKGHALDVVGKKLEKGEKIDLVIAVGCPFMMMLTARQTEPYKVKTLAALNPIMLDGTGMCGACRVTVGGRMKFACVDGPFFDAHLIDWDELAARRRAYGSQEINVLGRTEPTQKSENKHKCKIGLDE